MPLKQTLNKDAIFHLFKQIGTGFLSLGVVFLGLDAIVLLGSFLITRNSEFVGLLITVLVYIPAVVIKAYPIISILCIAAVSYLFFQARQRKSRVAQVAIIVAIAGFGLFALPWLSDIADMRHMVEKEVQTQPYQQLARLSSKNSTVTFALTKIIEKHSLFSSGASADMRGTWELTQEGAERSTNQVNYYTPFYGDRTVKEIACTYYPELSELAADCYDPSSRQVSEKIYPAAFYYVPEKGIVSMVQTRYAQNRIVKFFPFGEAEQAIASCEPASFGLDAGGRSTALVSYTWPDIVRCVEGRATTDSLLKDVVLKTDAVQVVPLHIDYMTGVFLSLLQIY